MQTTRSAALCLVAATLYSSLASADVTVNATLCNKTPKPVEFRLYNHNDMAAGVVPLVTKSVQACACVQKETHTDLWHNFPPANIRQLVFRDVGATKGTDIKACVDVEGKFKGYIDAKVNTCAQITSETQFLPAPELTGAQGDLPMLESRLLGTQTDCTKNSAGACTSYKVKYEYIDGSQCHGNDNG
jgi:hypothetical protein